VSAQESASADAIPAAEALIAVGRYAEAIEKLRPAISSDPQNPELHGLLGSALLGMKQWKEALRAGRSAAALAPDTVQPYLVIAFALLPLSKPRKALKAAMEALRLNPMEPASMHAVAEAQLMCGKVKDAEAMASRLIELQPESPTGFDLRGRALIGRKRFPLTGRKQFRDAEADFREALRLQPDDVGLNNNLGVALQEQKKKKEAIEAFERAAKADPTAKRPQENLVIATEKYIGVGGAFVALFLAARLAPPIGRAIHLPEGVVVAIFAVVIVFPFVVAWYIRRRRLRRLGPTVGRFYKHKVRWLRNVGLIYLAFRLGPLLAIAFGLLGLAIAEIPDFGLWFLLAVVIMIAWFAASPFVWRRTALRRIQPEIN
jgi:tetratricopeptide (TPR) repeat protein